MFGESFGPGGNIGLPSGFPNGLNLNLPQIHGGLMGQLGMGQPPQSQDGLPGQLGSQLPIWNQGQIDPSGHFQGGAQYSSPEPAQQFPWQQSQQQQSFPHNFANFANNPEFHQAIMALLMQHFPHLFGME